MVKGRRKNLETIMVLLLAGCTDENVLMDVHSFDSSYKRDYDFGQNAAVRTTTCFYPGKKDEQGKRARLFATSYGAKGDDQSDNTVAIRKAFYAAADLAEKNWPSSSCTVEVYFPAGLYRTSKTLFLKNRVALIGQDVSNTGIYNHGTGAVVDLRDQEWSCGQRHDARVESMQLGHRNNPNDAAGHCIRASTGLRDADFRNLYLTNCLGYGMGFQVKEECYGKNAVYERVSIQNVQIESSYMDAIDFKQSHADNEVNQDIQIFDLCTGPHIGFNDDGDGAAKALDLAGENIKVNRFTHINSVPNYGTTSVFGIVFHTGPRRVRNVVVHDFYINNAVQGIMFGGDDVENVQLGNGKIENLKSINGRLGIGLLVRGTRHKTSNVCVLNAEHAALVDSGWNNNVYISPNCPTSGVAAGYNTACELLQK